jgi:uncharacterized SAM-binding protein YcdF (DUF218 family)
LLRALSWLSALLIAGVLFLIAWGPDLLTAVDPMPAHVDAAIVLQGSMVAETARLNGAIGLVQRGIADRVLLSVPKQSYWGQSIPPVARAYIEKMYGSDLAARVDFCETSAEVNSTAQEADAAMGCIRQHQWQSIAIVTSDYHTRRARILWHRSVQERAPGIGVVTESVVDPEFQKPWWRHRKSVKICLGESLKLAWTVLSGR